MKNLRTLMLAAAMTMLGTMVMNADQWDKKTIMTTNEVITLPNATLQPGTYVLKLMNSDANRHIVQVFDKDGIKLVTTILAIPNYRLQPKGKTEFAFWETPAGQPKAMRAWFYPGDNFGQEFAYPKTSADTLAAANQNATVPVAEEVPAPIQVAEAAPMPTPAVPEQAPAPVQAPEPTPVAVAPTPEPVQMEQQVAQITPQEAPAMPQTASDVPLIALIGAASMLAFLGLGLRSHRAAARRS